MNIVDCVNLANQLLLKGKMDEAIKEYRSALSLKPDDAVIKENMALALISKGEYNEAEKLLENSANSPSACNLLGNIYFYKKDYKKAKGYYEMAIEINPREGDAWSNLGNIFFEMKKWNRAEECHRRSVEIDKNNPYWHMNLGKALLKEEKLELAIDAYKRALKLNSGLEEVKVILCNIYNGLAGVMLLENDYAGAYSLYKECKKNCPGVDLIKYSNLLRFK